MKHRIQHKLQQIDNQLQPLINQLIELRQNCPDGDKQVYSYVSKKVDQAGKAIGMALERIEENGTR